MATRFGGGLFRPLPRVEGDIARVRETLGSRGFDVAATSLDSSADEIADEIAELVETTRSGELSVLYLAGHGYRAKDASGDETDGWDESFVCSDRPIVDDWFRDELWPRAVSGARFVVVVDACHSESSTLGLRPGAEAVPAPERAPGRGYYRLTLSACRDQEVTRDRARCDAGGGIVTGELLYTLARDPSLSYRDLWSVVATSVRDGYSHTGVGTPESSYYGGDDSLLTETAFRADGGAA